MTKRKARLQSTIARKRTAKRKSPAPAAKAPPRKRRALSGPRNPLRRWLTAEPKPMTQAEFARRVGISQPFLTTLLDEAPPWPSRERLRKIIEVSGGAVTAQAWLDLDDPAPRIRT